MPKRSTSGSRRNRGNAQTLRNYWTRGPGAAKIAWGTPGDFNRCVSELSKYLGPRAKGYCNLRHKAATDTYPAQHAKALRAGRSKRR